MPLLRAFIAFMNEDAAALGVIKPDVEPRATQHIDGMLRMIERLLARGHAYQSANGDIYYDVSSFKSYGRLSGKRVEDLYAGARVEVDEAKDDPLDFVLWKRAKDGEPSWGSPWGPGRPGWHIECSAMSTECLGVHFDIHGGGQDLQFPHHENEIAQSEGATGQPFVNVWMHNGFVRVDERENVEIPRKFLYRARGLGQVSSGRGALLFFSQPLSESLELLRRKPRPCPYRAHPPVLGAARSPGRRVPLRQSLRGTLSGGHGR